MYIYQPDMRCLFIGSYSFSRYRPRYTAFNKPTERAQPLRQLTESERQTQKLLTPETMDGGTMFFSQREVNCTPDFMQATYRATDGVRAAVYCLAALQASVGLIGGVLNAACLATLIRYPLSAEVNGHFVSFALCDTAFLLFNLLDTVSHCLENSGPLAGGPAPFYYIVYVHPVAWTVRSVAYTVHCWQTVALSVLKCLRISRPLSAMSDGRLSLIVMCVWLYSLVSSIPPILLFQTFVSVLLSDCPGEGYRVAGSGYYAYYSGNRTASPVTATVAISPTFVAINSSLLPACICLVCSLIIVKSLRTRSSSMCSGGGELQRDNPDQSQPPLQHHHKHVQATVARQGREATRAVLLSVNSFLIFQIPMVMWTLVDRWFWPALEPATFSLLVVISNTLSQAFFAIDLSICLHSNHRFRAKFQRLLRPLGSSMDNSRLQLHYHRQQQAARHDNQDSSRRQTIPSSVPDNSNRVDSNLSSTPDL